MLKQCIAAMLVLALCCASWAAEGKPKKTYLAVFDFECAESPTIGKRLADSVRLYMGGHKDEYEVLDALTISQASGPLGIATEANTVAAMLDNKIAAHVGLYGTVKKDGEKISAEVRLVDRQDPNAGWTKTFSDTGERARGVIARQIVENLLNRGEWVPPQTLDTPEPKDFGKPINLGGDFEAAGGWATPDRVSTFIEDGPAGRGKVLRIKTDLQRDPWLEYTRKLRFGQADPNNPPKIGRDVSYASLAGMEGVFYVSDWIKATPGQRYWLLADMKGRSEGIFFPKIYVKGFLDWSDKADTLPEMTLQELKLSARDFAAMPADKRKTMIADDTRAHGDRYRREIFRWYLACRNEQDQWKHYADTCPPRGGLPANVQWLQIQIYAYWPPGEYLFDNIQLYTDPQQKAPLAEETPRTPGK